MKKNKFNNHIFRKQKPLNFQNNFVFVDTESQQIKENKKEILKFKMGSAIYWNRENNKKEKQIFYENKEFWDKIETKFTNDLNHLILFAHNTQHDLLQLNGYNELINRGFEVQSQYVKGKVFIFTFVKSFHTKDKENFYLHCWDTTNYFQESLEAIGKTLAIPKIKIDFSTCSKKELEIYCMRDVEIIFKLIKKLIKFLKKYNLSKLKATAGSISFNSYRHRFYNSVNDKKDIYNNIYIHDWKQAIKLERKSYKGGITECFEVQNEIENCFKADVNSLYPYVQKVNHFPFKLLLWEHESIHSQKYLFNQLKKVYDYNRKPKYKKTSLGAIIDCEFEIPKQYAYLLTVYNKKCCFLYGNKIRGQFAQPEIDFIRKYGKITHIYQISIYLMRDLFSEFVNFFAKFKIKFEQENNMIFRKFCKLVMNNEYGKWGQKDCEYINLTKEKYKKLYKEYYFIIKDMLIKSKERRDKNNEYISYLGTIVNFAEIYIIDKQIYAFRKLEKNAKESFVAIASFTTSYARMYLIKTLLLIKRENNYYCDTDSLFMNHQGYFILRQNNLIDDYQLGKWKIEGFGKAKFYNPKFYDFYDYKTKKEKRTLKGISQKSAIKIYENKKEVKYKTFQWEKFKTYMKKSNSSQIINEIPKLISKKYTKGLVDKNNRVVPFVNQI